jgi:hypothetical protein
MYASCSVQVNTLTIPNTVTPEAIYDLTTWFIPISNPNMKYYVNNFEATTPGFYAFEGDPGTTFTVEIRDNTIEEFELQCRASTTVQINAGCPIAIIGGPFGTGEYFYNDTGYFFSETPQPNVTYFTVGNQQYYPFDTIKTLFEYAYQGEDPNTKYSIQVKFRESYQGELPQPGIYINPGTSPSLNLEENAITGNEKFILQRFNAFGSPEWYWSISGGSFAPGDFWAGNLPGNDAPQGFNLLTDVEQIEIRAFSINPYYVDCQQSVIIKPPQNP